jgi:hypothetical protein
MHALVPRRSVLALPLALGAADGTEVWHFDRLDRLGNHPTTIFGKPELIETPGGKAVRFHGEPDALFVENHPLAGAETFTWEVVFRPESGGRAEQRFFHLQEIGSQHRLLFETRLMGQQWCLDSFAASSTGSQTLIDRSRLHALDEWHHVAMVSDGREFRHYVNHKLELAAPVRLAPQGPGRSSVGVRINKIDYFKGAVRLAIFHRRAIQPGEFTPLPGK